MTTPVIEESVLPPEQDVPTLPDEQLEQLAVKWLETKGEDWLKKQPIVDRRVSRYIGKEQRRLQQENAERRAQMETEVAGQQELLRNAQEFATWEKGLSIEDHDYYFRQHPEAALHTQALANAHRVLGTRPNPKADVEQQMQRTLDSARQRLLDSPALEDVEPQELERIGKEKKDFGEYSEAIVELALSQGRKELEGQRQALKEEFDKMASALRAEVQTMLHGRAEAPERTGGGESLAPDTDEAFIQAVVRGEAFDEARIRRLQAEGKL